jgi:hypothetical protein
VGALSTAFLGLGAAIAGWEIGKFLNQVTVAGETIETHLTRAVLYLKLEWLEFLTWFVPPGWLGGEWGRELSDQINTARQALADFQEEAKDRPEDNLFEEVSGGGGLSTPESVTRAERLEMEREWAEAELRFAETDERRNFVLQRQLSIAMELEEVRREEFNLAEAKGVADQDALKAEKALLTARTQRREIEKEIQKIYEDQAKERRRQFESTYPGGTQAQFDEFRARAALEAQMGGGRLGIVAGIQEAMMQLGTSAQIVGRAMSTFIGGAVDSIAGGIRGLLSMTMTWGQALRSIASGILNSVVDAIARMFAEWIVGRLLVSSVEKTAAAGELAAKAPVALMDSISSWGVAAAVGIAGLLAAMAALGSFESGGFTGAGPRKAPAGVVHRGEYVVPASSVSRLGLDWFEAAAAGMAPSSQGSDPSTGGRTLNQKLNVFLDRRAWIAASRDDIEAIAIDAMSRAGWRTPHA